MYAIGGRAQHVLQQGIRVGGYHGQRPHEPAVIQAPVCVVGACVCLCLCIVGVGGVWHRKVEGRSQAMSKLRDVNIVCTYVTLDRHTPGLHHVTDAVEILQIQTGGLEVSVDTRVDSMGTSALPS